MGETRPPWLDLSALERFVLHYDAQFDVVAFIFDRPQYGVMTEVDSNWYLKLSDTEVRCEDGREDREVIAIHHLLFRRVLLAQPFFERLFAPALEELRSVTGKTLDEDFRIEATAAELPLMSRVLLILLGESLARWEAVAREESPEESADYFGAPRRASG
jgi:hypothetical protein